MRKLTKSRRALRRALLCVAAVVGAGAWGGVDNVDANDSLLRPAKMPSSTGRRADFGEMRLEQLPWDTHILRADLGKDRPMAVAGFYALSKHLIVVAQSGRVYCLDRRNLEPRWVNTLRAPLFRAPAESATHITFLCKDYKGQFWLHSISKRSGEEGIRFPKRLAFSASSGVAANASMAFMGSLGSPVNNKTVESVNLISGRGGWGYRAPGLVFGTPQMDSTGQNVIFATDNGRVLSLPASVTPPNGSNWDRDIGGTVRGAPAVTPEHVLAGNRDGILYCLDVDNGAVRWMAQTNGAINSKPWALGGYENVAKDTGVEGADPVNVREYNGVALVRNVRGLFGYDINNGKQLFRDMQGGRPLVRYKNWLLTIDDDRKVCFRNADADYEAHSERLDLKVFELVPSNSMDGAIYAATADGSVVAAIPR